MKFAVKLKKKMIPEWQDAYLAYELLKIMLKPFKKTTKLCSKIHDFNLKKLQRQVSFEEIDQEDIEGLRVFESKFQNLLYSEIDKINTFFHLKLIEFKKEWELIRFNCLIFMENRQKGGSEEAKQIKHGIFIFYKKLDFLMEYVNLNMEGVRKVLKKHRKICKIFATYISLLDAKPQKLFENSYITKNSELLLKLKDDVKKMYLDIFYNKYNKNIGHKELKDMTKTRIISVWESHFYFFFCGSTLTLFLVILIMGWYGDIDPDDEETFKYIFPMFRGAVFIIIYIWLLAWNVYGWTRYFVNYKRIFNFNHHFSSVKEILKRGTVFSSVFLLMFIWYIVLNQNMPKLYDTFGFMDKSFIPLIIWVLILGYLFFPIPNTFNWEGRKYFFRLMFKIFFLSFFVIDFTMGWATDQMVSFVTPIKDLEYTFCYYISRMKDYDNNHPKECYQNTFLIGFMAAFVPVFYRMVQCSRSLLNKKKIFDPDLLNFCKYFFTLLVSIFSFLVGQHKENMIWTYLWIFFACISTIYSYSWDLKMDWGLLQPNKKNRFLRNKLIYPRNQMYYFAIIINFFLRCAWILTISPGLVSTIMRPELFTLIIGSLEMLRRSIWNFLRVEKEFIMNSENYQALEKYSLPYKLDVKCSLDDDAIKLASKEKNKNSKNLTMEREENDDEFRKNFGFSKSSDLKWPLLMKSYDENESSNVSKNASRTELLKKKVKTINEETILEIEDSFKEKKIHSFEGKKKIVQTEKKKEKKKEIEKEKEKEKEKENENENENENEEEKKREFYEKTQVEKLKSKVKSQVITSVNNESENFELKFEENLKQNEDFNENPVSLKNILAKEGNKKTLDFFDKNYFFFVYFFGLNFILF